MTIQTTSQLSLCPMLPADIPEVLEIEAVSFSNPWKERDFLYALEKDHGIARVCRVEGIVQGYAVGFGTGEEFHLADFAVRPYNQRKGYGSVLLGILVDELIQSGFRVITLEVRQSNQAAVRLYERSGFNTVAIRRRYYSHPVEDALVMVKSLSGKLSDWVSRAMNRTSEIGESG